MFQTLGQLVKLKRLYIYDARLSGEGLQRLQGLQQLEILLLQGCPIDDAALQKLPMLAALRELHLGATTSDSFQGQVSAEAIKRLKEQRPQLKVLK